MTPEEALRTVLRARQAEYDRHAKALRENDDQLIEAFAIYARAIAQLKINERVMQNHIEVLQRAIDESQGVAEE